MAFVKYNMECPECHSSRGYGIDDGGFGHCFKCGHRAKEESNGRVIPLNTRSSHTEAPVSSQGYSLPNLLYRDLRDRKISVQVCEKYGVGFRGEDLVFPIGTSAKVRIRGEKNFAIEGDWKDNTQLFGQERFNSGGKYVLVTEGELDTLAAYQMLGNDKYPIAVVSVRNGAQSALKDCKANFDWLDTFEYVVFNFDNDPVGLEAQSHCAELFSHKAKCMVAVNGLKDASDYLMDNRAGEYTNNFWRAERWTPDGIIAGASLYDAVMKPIEKSDVEYPFDGLNSLTYGIRKGELVTVTAGSGLGKSQFLREIIWHIIQHTESNIGLMFLEESTRRTGLSLMSLAADKPLHLPDTVATQQEKDDAFNKTLGTDRVYLFDHFGSTDVDNIVNRVRYLAKVVGCDYVFVDHISIIVSAQSNGDERKAIDEIMTKLRMLVQETGISLVCVSHLKRPENRGHEEGAATSLAQLRGSGAIAQLSDMVLGLERNGQADDAAERNTTRVRVLKNRFSGITGKACALLYSHETGRMREIDEEAL